MDSDQVSLGELCSVLRSKNGGPFLITLDMIFREKRIYETMKMNNLITKELIAEKYGIPPSEVLVFEYFDDVGAIKASIKRRVTSGCPGDSDCYGMAQEAPLLYIKFPKGLLEPT